MKHGFLPILTALWLALPPISIAAGAQSALSPEELHRRTVERRAVEAVIWGMPAVNYDLMLQEMLTKTAGKVNQVIYWGRPLDWRNQTLTPNPDTLYFMAFFNTKDVGPIVIEIPPAGADGSMNANIVNVWQEPLEDAGLLGVDKGKGVKLLMLPPGYSEPDPRRLHRAAARHVRQLRAVPLEPRRATATPTSRSPWPTASGSRSIRSRRPPTRRRPCSPTSRTSISTRPSATTRASSSGSTGSCRASRGSIAIGS